MVNEETSVKSMKAQAANQVLGHDLALNAGQKEKVGQESPLLQVLLDSIPDAIFFKDTASRFTGINRAQAEVLGLADPSQAIGKREFDFIDQARSAYEEEQAIMQTGRPLIDKIEKIKERDGRFRWTTTTKVPVTDKAGKVTGLVGISRDITQHQLADQCQAAQFDVTFILAGAATVERAIPKLLQVICEDLGWEVGELWRVDAERNVLCCGGMWHSPSIGAGTLKQRSRDFIFPPGRGLPGRIWASGRPLWISDLGAHPDFAGTGLAAQADLRNACAIPVSVGSEVACVLVFFSRQSRDRDEELFKLMTDIGGQIGQFMERKSAEERLSRINECFLSFGSNPAENIQRLTALAGQLLGGVSAWYSRLEANQLCLVGQWNTPAGFEASRKVDGCLGYDVIKTARDTPCLLSDLLQSTFSLTDPQVRAYQWQTYLGQAVKCGRAYVGSLNIVYQRDYIPSQADQKILGIVASAIGVEENNHCVQRERQLFEVQLRQSQKLEAIGQLAAGIAHEINTPIQYVGDNTRFLKEAFEKLGLAVQRYRALLYAGKAGAIMSGLIQQFEQELEDADVAYLTEQIPAALKETLEGVERVTKIVRAMKEFSHPGLKEKAPIDIHKAIETTLMVARNEWKYVAEVATDFDGNMPLVPGFANELNQVILNLLVNAAHAIGEAIRGQTDKKGTITVRTRRVGEWAEIRVSDTGTGIPVQYRSRIFEPFFTTKEVGKGTGQGLALVYAVVVKKHGGTVSFETELGHGTTFIVRLPLESE